MHGERPVHGGQVPRRFFQGAITTSCQGGLEHFDKCRQSTLEQRTLTTETLGKEKKSTNGRAAQSEAPIKDFTERKGMKARIGQGHTSTHLQNWVDKEGNEDSTAHD